MEKAMPPSPTEGMNGDHAAIWSYLVYLDQEIKDVNKEVVDVSHKMDLVHARYDPMIYELNRSQKWLVRTMVGGMISMIVLLIGVIITMTVGMI